MNFFGMGPGELMLIALLGMIIFGPGKLPEIASQLGRTVRDFRRSTAEINSEFQRAFSLDEPEAAPEPVGPATAFATNGVAAVEATGEVNGSAPLANSSEWNWESSGAEQPSAEAAPPPSPPSFWDWDSPEPAAAVAVAEPAESAAAEADGSIWRWDSDETTAVADAPTAVAEANAAVQVIVPPAVEDVAASATGEPALDAIQAPAPAAETNGMTAAPTAGEGERPGPDTGVEPAGSPLVAASENGVAADRPTPDETLSDPAGSAAPVEVAEAESAGNGAEPSQAARPRPSADRKPPA